MVAANKSQILTSSEVDAQVQNCKGTWVKRRNLRIKLKAQSNLLVVEEIKTVRAKIRDLRAMGAKEEMLRHWYSQLTKFELMILE